jgi:hypothetical protein
MNASPPPNRFPFLEPEQVAADSVKWVGTAEVRCLIRMGNRRKAGDFPLRKSIARRLSLKSTPLRPAKLTSKWGIIAVSIS